MNFLFLWQAIGLIALSIQIVWCTEKRDKKFFLFLSTSSFFWAIHYFMLWLISWSIVNFIDVGKNLLWYKKYKNTFIFLVLLLLYSSLWMYLFDWTILWTLPIIASLLSIYAIFYSGWENLRLYYAVIMSIWLFYNILGFSIPWIVTNVLLLSELMYTYYKIHNQRRKYKQKVQNILTKI